MPTKKSKAVTTTKAPTKKKPSAEVTIPDDQSTATVEAIREQLRIARDLELRIDEISSVVKSDNKALNSIKFELLPEMFAEAGVDNIGLPAEGNKPAYDAKLVPFYKANIAADWEEERRDKAFKELEKRGAGDLIKTEVTVLLPRGEREKLKALEKVLKSMKLDYEVAANVPHGTLTAWVKEQIVEHQKIIPLDTFGATMGMVVHIKERKTRNGK